MSILPSLFEDLPEHSIRIAGNTQPVRPKTAPATPLIDGKIEQISLNLRTSSLTPRASHKFFSSKQLRSSVAPYPRPVFQDSRFTGLEPNFSTILRREQEKADDLLIDWLYLQGYDRLGDILKQERGTPWDSIKRLKSPLLMEQVAQLYQLSKDHKANVTKLMQFCFAIIPLSAHLSSDSKAIDSTNILIGKILLLASLDIQQLTDFLDLTEIDKSIEKINLFVSKQFDLVADRLSQHEQNHSNAGLQDSQQAYATRLPFELSNLLILNNGYLNTGLIPAIREKWLNSSKSKLAYEMHLEYVLKSLEGSPQLRNKLSSIQAPSNNTPSAHIIRILLERPPNFIISDTHAKRSGLMTLLSHLRQGNSGSCFATYVAIEMMSSSLERCLADFSEILHKSKLTRKVNGIKVEFPFLMKVSSSVSNQSITIQRNGYLDLKKSINCGLWRVPGILAACKAIGVQDPTSIILSCLRELFPTGHTSSNITITVHNLLKEIVQQAIKKEKKLSMEGIAVLQERALLAYEGQTHNLLLRMWENAIANTAEARDSGMLKQSLVKAIVKPIQEKVQALFAIPPKHSLLESITKTLNQRIQLMFDPNEKYTHQNSDSHSSEGAFSLFDKGEFEHSTNWKRIESPESFQQFVMSAVRQANASENPHSPPCLSPVNITEFAKFVYSNNFLKHALEIYNSANSINADLAAHLGSLQHAPWLDKTGNDPREVLRIYFEKNENNFQELTSTPYHTQGFFKDIINIARRIDPALKSSIADNPRKRLPLIVHGLHACSLMIGHPSFQKIWSSGEDPEKWLNEKMIAKGLEISNASTSEETRTKMIKFMSAKIEEKYLNKFITSAKAGPYPLQKFRDWLLGIAKFSLANEHKNLDKLCLDLDAYIYSEALPEEHRRILRETAVHFADTNWRRGIHDTHFAFVFNPGTAQMELKEVLENGNAWFDMPFMRWVRGQKWVCIPEPAKSLI